MKTILIHSLAGNNEQLFNPYERDGYNDPIIYLRERFYEKGYLLKAADHNSLDDCEWVLFYEGTSVNPYNGWRGLASRLKAIVQGKPLRRNLFKECLKAGMEHRTALFLWEPPSVLSVNWNPSLHKLFPLIFTWHDSYIDGEKFIKIYWPQTRLFPAVPIIDFKDKKLLVNISMNKFSSHPRELYSERRMAIRYFEQNQPENFDLYGVGWDHPTIPMEKRTNSKFQIYPSYCGTVINKWDILPKYRFSLCYENIRDEPGFITEKIFDCMRARCIPIYWGAPNITDYVDKGTFIDRRDFKSNKELENYLIGIDEQKYNNFQDAINKYLASDRFAKFLPPNYADTIISTLKL